MCWVLLLVVLHWWVKRRFVGTASLGKGLGAGRRSCINKKHRISIIQTRNVIYCRELKGITGRFMGKKSFAGWRHTNMTWEIPELTTVGGWDMNPPCPGCYLVPPGMSTTLCRQEKTNTA